MAVDVGERGAGRKRGPVDPVETRAGHLHELETPRRRPHCRGERERDQHVDLRHARDDGRLVCQDDVARDAQMGPDPLRHADGERAGEGDVHPSTICVWMVMDSRRPDSSVTRVCHTMVRLPR